MEDDRDRPDVPYWKYKELWENYSNQSDFLNKQYKKRRKLEALLKDKERIIQEQAKLIEEHTLMEQQI